MKRILLATACLAAAIAPARAVIPVTDELGLPQWIAQGATALQQLQQLRQSYQQLTNVYGSLAHLNSVADVATVLGQPLVRNSMPAAASVGNLLGGGTSPSGLLNSAQGFLQRNQVYRPTGNDPAAQAMNGNAMSLANIQGMAQQSLDSIQTRMAGLDELQNTIDGQPDVQALAAVQARIASEGTFIQSQQVQATQLQTLAITQAQAQGQAEQQSRRQSADALLAATTPIQ